MLSTFFCNQISSIFYHTVWQISFSQKVQFTKRYLSHCNWISKILRIVIFKYFFLMPREMGVIMSCYCRYCVVFLALQGFFLFGFTRMWHLIDVGYKSSANKTCWIWFRLSWLYRKKGVKFNQFSRQEAEKKSGQW